jgi:hypothetical protein
MRKVSALAIVAMALLSAESATAELPLPSVPGFSPVPTVTAPSLLDPVLEAVPPLPSAPQLPDVSLPAVPRLPAVPNVSDAPNVPAVPPLRRPSTSQGGATTGASTQTRDRSSGGSGAAPTGGSGATSTGGSRGDTSGAGRRAGSGSPASGRRTTARRVRRERRLRTTVRRLQTCFGGLSRLERRVLVLRAGIGAGPPRTRTQVARRLDVSTRRVTRLERRGVRTLRSLAGGGRCGGVGARSTAGAPVAEPRMAAALQGLHGRPIGSGGAADATDVKGERKSSGDGQGSGDAAGPATLEQRVPAPARVRLLGLDLTVPLLIALGLTGLWFVVRAVRRTLGSDPLG